MADPLMRMKIGILIIILVALGLALVVMWIFRPEKEDCYVIYPDGTQTGLMTRSNAKNYQQIFGGTIKRQKETPQWNR